MTHEEKSLLLKDLCARLPYGVKCSFISSKGDISSTIVKIDVESGTVSHKPDGQSNVYFHWIESGYIKPYLRPMSSMTIDEQYEYDCRCPDWYMKSDFCNKHHLDYRGLIDKGLALEAQEGMYKTE